MSYFYFNIYGVKNERSNFNFTFIIRLNYKTMIFAVTSKKSLYMIKIKHKNDSAKNLVIIAKCCYSR